MKRSEHKSRNESTACENLILRHSFSKAVCVFGRLNFCVDTFLREGCERFRRERENQNSAAALNALCEEKRLAVDDGWANANEFSISGFLCEENSPVPMESQLCGEAFCWHVCGVVSEWKHFTVGRARRNWIRRNEESLPGSRGVYAANSSERL